MKSTHLSPRVSTVRASAAIQRIQGVAKTIVDKRPQAIAQRKLQVKINSVYPPAAKLKHKVFNPQPLISQWQPLQLAKANIKYQINGGEERHVDGVEVGKGSVGGQTHSEQKIWGKIDRTIIDALIITGAQVVITFVVDTAICEKCTPWFENDVWNTLNSFAEKHNSTFILNVSVGGRTIRVNGKDTIWPPEISDLPSFNDRIADDMERSFLFMNEERDASGVRLEGEEKYSDYVKSQWDSLKDYFTNYESINLNLGDDGYQDAAEEASNILSKIFDKAKARAIKGSAPKYESVEGATDDSAKESKMKSFLDTLTLHHAITLGNLTIPTVDQEMSRNNYKAIWEKELINNLHSFFEEEMDGNENFIPQSKPY